MAGKPISVKIQPKKGSEEAFFAEQDQHKLRALREKAVEEASKKYCEEHKYHCFRCGTQSLAEIDEGNVKIDICVNENCGAIHLDPGELKEIIKDQGSLSAAKNAFLSVFKKYVSWSIVCATIFVPTYPEGAWLLPLYTLSSNICNSPVTLFNKYR